LLALFIFAYEFQYIIVFFTKNMHKTKIYKLLFSVTCWRVIVYEKSKITGDLPEHVKEITFESSIVEFSAFWVKIDNFVSKFGRFISSKFDSCFRY